MEDATQRLTFSPAKASGKNQRIYVHFFNHEQATDARPTHWLITKWDIYKLLSAVEPVTKGVCFYHYK